MIGASRLTIVGGVVAIAAFGLAAVLFLGDNSAATERLALLFAMFGTILPALLGALRSDQAKAQSDGTLTALTAQSEAFRAELPTHVQTAVLAALAAPHPDNGTPVDPTAAG